MTNLVLHSADAFEAEEATGDLAARSIRGGAVSMVGQVAQFVFQVGGTVVLARLLTPRDFGLVAMVTVILTLGVLLRDAGLATATVQAKELTRDQCSLLFWVNAAAGVVLAGCLAAAGPLIAWFYGQEELLWISVGLAVPLALGGLYTQHWALLRRSMRFGAMMVGQVGSYGAYFIAAVVAALLGCGYWSLVIANAAGIVVNMAFAFFCCRWVPSRPKRAAGVAKFLRFGGNVLGSNVVTYFAGNADSILVGRFLGANPLGLYNRAYNFVALPVSQFRELIERVGLPVLRRLVDEPERFRRYYLKMANMVATAAFPLGAICILEGEFFIRVLLGEQWLEATSVFRILGAVMIVRPIVATMEVAQLSLGESRRFLYWNLATAALFVASFAAGLPWGIAGVAGGYAIANFAVLVPAALYCLAKSPVRIRHLARELLAPLGLSALLAGLVLAMHAVVGYSLLWRGVGVALFVATYCGLSLARPAVREVIRPLLGSSRRAEERTG